MEYIFIEVSRAWFSAILFSSFTTPLRVAFFDEDDIVWILVETLIDIFFLTDLVFTFFSAYYNKMETLISSRR